MGTPGAANEIPVQISIVHCNQIGTTTFQSVRKCGKPGFLTGDNSRLMLVYSKFPDCYIAIDPPFNIVGIQIF